MKGLLTDEEHALKKKANVLMHNSRTQAKYVEWRDVYFALDDKERAALKAKLDKQYGVKE
jgi:hypothetical protein